MVTTFIPDVASLNKEQLPSTIMKNQQLGEASMFNSLCAS